jgi:hypothetical protein
VKILNQLEDHFNVPKKTVTYETTMRGVRLFIADHFWLKTTALYSLYSFLIRAIMGSGVQSLDELDKDDCLDFCTELKKMGVVKTIQKLLDLNKKVPGQLIFQENNYVYSRHGTSGFVAALNPKYNNTIYKEVIKNA